MVSNKKFLPFLLLALISILKVDAQTVPSLKKVSSMQDNLIYWGGFSNWYSTPGHVETDFLKSSEFGFLVMGQRMIPSGILGIAFGPGFSSQNVHSNAIITKDNSASFSYLTAIPDSVDYKVNKLSLNFIDAQLEIRLHSKPNAKNKLFKFSAGIKGGILLQSHTKFKDKNHTYKKSRIEDLNKYQYGMVSRLGYGNVSIGGYYSMIGIFKDKKGPELIPYHISLYLTF